MKRFMLFVACFVFAISAIAEDPLSFVIGTSPIKVDLDRDQSLSIVNTYTNGTYAQGSTVLYGPYVTFDGHDNPSGGNVYMAYTNASEYTVATSNPVHTAGIVNGWVFIKSGRNQRPVERHGIAAVLLSSNCHVSVSIGASAVINKGETLTSINSSWTMDHITQDPVYFVSDITNAVISLQRW